MVNGDRRGAARKLVTVVIDGVEYQAEEGRNMLDVALALGFDLPYFCWHPVMGSIGACRQCAVRLYWTDREGNEKSEIAMACMTEAQEGTKIDIFDPDAIRFRAEMIELMMLSHPHDCPVCEEGGECHLQDMTVMTGHSYRRYRGRKRTWVNQDLGPFVTHELNRCITCYRCTRFYNDYAGGRDFGVFGIRNQVYFGRAESGTLESEFSGNLIEVCPTGVFDDKPFSRRYTRKWDLQTAPSVCPNCGLGCTTTPGARYGELRRVLSRYNPDINTMFLCDRGRFGFEFVNAAERVRQARVTAAVLPPTAVTDQPAGAPAAAEAAPPTRMPVPEAPTEEAAREQAAAMTGMHPERTGGRAGGEAAPLTGELALDAAAGLLRGRRALGIGSPRASLEANYALRALVGPANFFRGMSDTDDRLVSAVLAVAADPRLRLASAADIHDADAVLVLGEDVTNTAPMLDLAIRTWLHLRPNEVEERNHIRRWNDAGITRIKRREPSALWIATTHATKLDEVAAGAHRAAPDDLVRLALAIAHEVDAEAPPVAGLGEDEAELARRWAASLSAGTAPLVVAGCSTGSSELVRAAAQLTLALRRACHLRAGVDCADLVLTVPEPDSLGLRLLGGGTLVQGLAAIARGEADVLVVLDGGLEHRVPAMLVDDLLRRDIPVIALPVLEDRLTARADVVLPAATFAEETGTWVNHEGRAQRYFSMLPPRGDVRPAWRWLRELLVRLGRREARGWKTPDDVLAAMEMELPAFRGVTAVAPPAGWRDHGRKVARQPLRWSGRTAVDADRTVFEPGPVPDPDAPFAYSLEGLQPQQSPDALRARTWWPGWNSSNGLHRFGEELRAVGPAQPSGVRLLDGAGGGPELPQVAAPPRFTPRAGEVLLVALPHIYGSEELSMYTPGIRELAPAPYIGLNAEDAERLEVREGDLLELWLPWMDTTAPFRLVPSLVTGTAGLPVGLPGLPYISLPARARLSRAEGQ
ncbi:MAG: NADH-quinone oxidoreductase subunit G [Actinobacteria bacterium]|nr:NADH-quinone oxidoreductase subunit G [Actinomycetota bacterium]